MEDVDTHLVAHLVPVHSVVSVRSAGDKLLEVLGWPLEGGRRTRKNILIKFQTDVEKEKVIREFGKILFHTIIMATNSGSEEYPEFERVGYAA